MVQCPQVQDGSKLREVCRLVQERWNPSPQDSQEMEGSGQVEGFGGRWISGTLSSLTPGGHPMQTEVVVGFRVPGAPVQEGKVLHS